MTQKTSAVVLWLIGSLACAADQCSLESLTNDCRIFDPTKPKIEIPGANDGTFIPNFAAIAKEQTSDSEDDEASKNRTTARQSKYYERAADAMTILENPGASEGQMSPMAKYYLSNDLRYLNTVLNPNAKLFATSPLQFNFSQFQKAEPEKIRVVWPLTGNGQMQEVPLRDVRAALLQLLTSDQKDQLLKIAKDAEKDAIENSDAGTDKRASARELRQAMLAASPDRQKHVLGLVEFARKQMIDIISGENRNPS